MAASAVLVHEYRCGSILQHLGSRLLAGVGQPLLGIVDYQLFAESVDEVLRTS